ncbi:MAG: ABC transporter ATP-binding protein, partial [Dehalococcoidia bacterium]|nr:ABC transporter ATP-binding protein [Dehalococcoidia bacterium]
MNPIVRLNTVSKLYGNFTAVNNLNLEIRDGEILGLIGHNG